MTAKIAALVVAVWIGISGANAEGSRIRSVRVSVLDVAESARFYNKVFNLVEVRRIHRDGEIFEIIMNYGETAEEAGASRAPRLVLIAAAPGAPPPSVSNLIFGVEDMTAVISRAEAEGGKVSRPPKTSESSGAVYAFIRDPAGNEIELIQE